MSYLSWLRQFKRVSLTAVKYSVLFAAYTRTLGGFSVKLSRFFRQGPSSSTRISSVPGVASLDGDPPVTIQISSNKVSLPTLQSLYMAILSMLTTTSPLIYHPVLSACLWFFTVLIHTHLSHIKSLTQVIPFTSNPS